MKNDGILLALVAALTAWTGSARAWDGPGMWTNPADAAFPGGGGIYATGGQGDYAITCAHCHIGSTKQIGATITAAPPFQTAGLGTAYKPGQAYTITVALTGEHLGLGACGQYMSNANGFAATVEGGNGLPTGVLSSDSGQSAASCPAANPTGVTTGTSVTYGDCRVAVARGGLPAGAKSWTFGWTAPAVGAGAATLYVGVVDGDCSMSSLGDDVAMIAQPLAEGNPLASAAPRRNRPVVPWLAAIGVAAVGAILSLRRRRG
jgi:hypothetical protein